MRTTSKLKPQPDSKIAQKFAILILCRTRSQLLLVGPPLTEEELPLLADISFVHDSLNDAELAVAYSGASKNSTLSIEISDLIFATWLA